ncbi:MAG: TIGR01777 family protein [Phycisphaera sp.]|nr:TIGR01777 family protein [Phycisphaera sp.]
MSVHDSGSSGFERRTRIEVPAERLGAWHFRAGAIHRLIPPWERIEVEQEASPLVDGARARIIIRKGPIRTKLVAVHSEVDPPRQFVDTQESGPFAAWRHVHRFQSTDAPGASVLEDSIRYRMPLGALGRILLGRPMAREIARQFAFRHARTRHDLLRHAEFSARFGDAPMRVGVTGASGLVGKQLCAFLSTGGHEVVRFVRGTPRHASERRWDPRDIERGVDPASVADLDCVVHLAGAGIADRRWSEARKREIHESRVLGTAAIARGIARAKTPPRAFVSSSAIGFYGDRGSEWVDERSARGAGFLADICEAWEAATAEARDAGVRTVHLRTGVVLTAAGGALAKMLPAFLAGAGGPIGSGRQGFSWISLDDLLSAIVFAARDERLAGPVNTVAPDAPSQREFARVLGRVVRRPSFAPLPAFVVKILFGEMGERALLEGAFVRPLALHEAGFRFAYPRLEDALRLELGRIVEEGGGR